MKLLTLIASALLLAMVWVAPASAQLTLPAGAENWPQQCADGDADACVNQGIRFEQGIETPVNLAGAGQYWTKACQLRSEQGCDLAYALYSGTLPAFPKDPRRMVMVAAFACEINNKLLCADAAIRLYSGDGVPKNVKLAMPLYGRACDLGDPLACATAATVYLDGEEGMPVDAQQALIYGKKGCALNETNACRVVEVAYLFPDRPTFDPKMGLEYALKNCEARSKESCYNLADVYITIEDYGRAGRYYDMACDMGLTQGCTSSQILSKWMKERAEYEAYEARQQERKAALDQIIAKTGHDAALRVALYEYNSPEMAQYVIGRAGNGGNYSTYSTNNLYVLSLWFPGKPIGAAADKELASRGTGLEGRFGEDTNAPGMAEARYRSQYGSNPPRYASSSGYSAPQKPVMGWAEASAATRARYRTAHCTMNGNPSSIKICQ